MQRPQPQASLETVQVYEDENRLLAQQCLELVRTNRALKRDLHQLFCQHPDYEIFASLPGAGQLLALPYWPSLGMTGSGFLSQAVFKLWPAPAQ